ncbi:putative glutamine transport system substrate-binding protein [Natronospira proteinivora]|uniref:Glutamine transport system substrate-binding protein n=1 Tax=Natronospira proteinivora TaxID=1807133 RepID=A0ABT1G5M7_9GAMM|nr:transporter substrate-binding domain-containing protein [Natronospira proteinivora]MCP1726598.1 putative glutamine transport system substrate-binding protein [Natronospira proteinivora]
MPIARTIATLAAAILFTSSLSAEPDRGDNWEDVRETGQGEIQILYVPAGGWAYRDSDEDLTGATVELMREFAAWVEREHGIELAVDFVRDTDWSRFYDRVRQAEGGVFGIGNVTITEARREELAFSPPYVTNVAVLITHADHPELETPETLAEQADTLSALAFRDTLHEQRLQALRQDHAPDIPLARAESNDEIIERVVSGDYFAYIDAYNYHRAREAGEPLRHHSAFDDPGEAFGVIMPHDSNWAALMEAFFEHDGGWTRSETWQDILTEHLGETVAEQLLEAH